MWDELIDYINKMQKTLDKMKDFAMYLKSNTYTDYDEYYDEDEDDAIAKLDLFLNKLRNLYLHNKCRPLDISMVISELEKEEDLDEHYIMNCLHELLNEGTIYEPARNKIAFINTVYEKNIFDAKDLELY